jgi:hypothetical protein
MLRDTVERSEFELESVARWGSDSQRQTEPRWRIVHRALRRISLRRAALDAEEARWLREAEALQIWRPLGMVSALDYLERVLGYAPRTAQDRLRVARALGDLPALSAALASGKIAFSAVRELTRVATPATELSWIAAVAGKNLRQVEELVADHRPGDRPDDPPNPEARTHVVRFELAAQTFALLRQARTILDAEHGTNLGDDPFVAALCSAVLDAAPTAESTGRAKFQIALTVCQRCRQGWQEGAGAQIPVDATAVDRAMCDAQHLGSIDGSAPERAYQDIAPSVARFVWRRDGGRCRVPGCRSARGLELHHLIHRADGGSHDAANLILACSACHQAHHAGALTISGTADHLEVGRPAANTVGDACDLAEGTRSEGAWSEGAWSEGARSEGARSEGARSEGARSEGARSEAAGSDAARSEGARSEGTRSDAARSEGARSEAAGSDAARSEGARSEGAGSEAAGPDAAGSDAAGSDAAGSEGARSEAAGSDAAGSEGARSEGAWSEGAWSEGAWSEGAWSEGARSEGASPCARVVVG